MLFLMEEGSTGTEIKKELRRENKCEERRIEREGKISIPTISSSKAVYDKKRIR